MIIKEQSDLEKRKILVMLLAIGAAALIIRLTHWVLTTKFNPLAGHPIIDSYTYDKWAQALAFGKQHVSTKLTQGPLYPWFVTLLYRLFGRSPSAVRLAQALLGTASCIFIAEITRKLFRSTAATIIAGVLAVLYLPFIFYEGIMVPATLILFLNALFVMLILSTEKPAGTWRLLFSGIVLGLSVTAKPVALFLFPFAALHLILKGRTGAALPAGTSSPRARKQVLLLLAGLIIALIPLQVRNARIAGEFIPFGTGGGINFYIGNNEKANGFYYVPSYKGKTVGGLPEIQEKRMREIAAAESGRELSGGEVSNFWLRKGIEHNLKYPGRWAKLLWNKFLFFWNKHERANVENINFHRRFPGVLKLPLPTFGVVVPLALLGIFLTRQRWKELWLLYGGIVSYLAIALIFYILARYRLPAVPFLIPFAGAAIYKLVKLVRDRHTFEFVLYCVSLALLVFFVNIPLVMETPKGFSNNFTRLGNAYIARGDTTSAAGAYREALKLDPENRFAKKHLKELEGI